MWRWEQALRRNTRFGAGRRRWWSRTLALALGAALSAGARRWVGAVLGLQITKRRAGREKRVSRGFRDVQDVCDVQVVRVGLVNLGIQHGRDVWSVRASREFQEIHHVRDIRLPLPPPA